MGWNYFKTDRPTAYTILRRFIADEIDKINKLIETDNSSEAQEIKRRLIVVNEELLYVYNRTQKLREGSENSRKFAIEEKVRLG